MEKQKSYLQYTHLAYFRVPIAQRSLIVGSMSCGLILRGLLLNPEHLDSTSLIDFFRLLNHLLMYSVSLTNTMISSLSRLTLRLSSVFLFVLAWHLIPTMGSQSL